MIQNEILVRLWQQHPEHRRYALGEICNRNTGFIDKFAKKARDTKNNYFDFKSHSVPYVELAISRFDLTRGLKFISYLVWHMKSALTDFNRMDGLVRPHIKKGKIIENNSHSLNKLNALGIEPISNLRAEAEEYHDTKTYSDAVLSCLTPKERKIVELYFGIGSGETMTLESISERLGITREYVRLIKEGATKKMRATVRFENLIGTPIFTEIKQLYQR